MSINVEHPIKMHALPGGKSDSKGLVFVCVCVLTQTVVKFLNWFSLHIIT